MSSVTLLHRKLLATVAASLLAAGPSPAKVIPLGMVTHAERAHVGEGGASVGSTIYDGDRLSTEMGGVLRITSIALTLQLDAGSSVLLRRAAVPEGNVQAELGSGNVFFSTGQAASITVFANDALVSPAAHASTIAQIRIVNRRELRIDVRRGVLNFSYHGESALIPEGAAYLVLLDPSAREIRAASDSGDGGKHPIKLPKFILIAIAIAAGVAIPVVIHALESPDTPGLAPLKKP
jgi:hypothetical protein